MMILRIQAISKYIWRDIGEILSINKFFLMFMFCIYKAYTKKSRGGWSRFVVDGGDRVSILKRCISHAKHTLRAEQ